MTNMGQSAEDDRRSCWVCFATDEDDRTMLWVKPCKCRGATKWVHQECLQRWIDEKQLGDLSMAVSCPQCNTPYVIVFPDMGPMMLVMEKSELVVRKACPYIAASLFLGSVYWTAVTYGSVTIMQVLGHKEGLAVMERADPLFLIIGLPTIPVMLVLGKMIRWENYVLKLWRKHSSQLPILNHIFSDEPSPVHTTESERDIDQVSDPLSATRVLCGAIALPTIATIAGKLMFGRVQSNFQRTLLGGIAFIVIKGMLKIYYKQQLYVRHVNRLVMDYKPPSDPDNGTNNRTNIATDNTITNTTNNTTNTTSNNASNNASNTASNTTSNTASNNASNNASNTTLNTTSNNATNTSTDNVTNNVTSDRHCDGNSDRTATVDSAINNDVSNVNAESVTESNR